MPKYPPGCSQTQCPPATIIGSIARSQAVITSPLTATGTATTPLSYTITANYGVTFGASGAAWLSVDPATAIGG
jgi:hypothetical protein